jgi:hypothetical protein
MVQDQAQVQLIQQCHFNDFTDGFVSQKAHNLHNK